MLCIIGRALACLAGWGAGSGLCTRLGCMR
jgi:hypothetical protein